MVFAFLLVFALAVVPAAADIGDIITVENVNYMVTCEDPRVVEVHNHAGTGSDPITIRSTVQNSSTQEYYTVTGFREGAFANCTNLTNVTIESGVKTINKTAFRGSSLTSVTFEGDVTSIEEGAFMDCPDLEWVLFEGTAGTIGTTAFYNNTNTKLTDVTFEKAVTSIGESAFAGQTKLTDVTFKGGVETIGTTAFANCISLKEIFILSGVTSIGESAFGDCTALTDVTIEGAVGTIGTAAFNDCIALTGVTFEGNVGSIGNSAFQGCVNLEQVEIGGTVGTIGNSAFVQCYALKSIDLSGATSIGQSAFQDCINLTSVTIPDSVTSIGNSAFWGCTDLTSVTIGNDVTSIGDSAFQYCFKLETVTINDGTGLRIGSTAFRYTALKEIAIPSSVTSIGEGAFANNTGLATVTFFRDPAPAIGPGAFHYVAESGTVNHPGQDKGYDRTFFFDAGLLEGWTRNPPLTYNVTVSASGSGTVSGGKDFIQENTPLTVTATPNSGHHFASWTEDGTTVSTSSSYTFTVENYRHLVANFAANSPYRSGSSGGGLSSAPVVSTGTGSMEVNEAGVVARSAQVNAGDGIANLYVPAGTTVLDGDGNPVESISVSPVTGVQDAPAGFQFAGYVYQASPAGATFDPAITLTFAIPDDVWEALDPDNLVVKWYNEETGIWEDVPTTVAPGAKSVIATVSHFSTFALFTGEAATVVHPIETVTTVTEVTAVAAETTPQAAGFSVIFQVFGVLLVLGVLLAVRRR